MAFDDTKDSTNLVLSSDWNDLVADLKNHSARHNPGGSDELDFSSGGAGIYPHKVKNKTGADCSGSNGDKNRVLTCDNTSHASTMVMVIKDRVVLHEDKDYTVSHGPPTTITFLDKLADDSNLEVMLWM